MVSSTGRSAQQRLDEVQGLAQLDGLAPEDFTRQLRDELVADTDSTLAAIEAWDARLRDALSAIDAFAIKSMRIRLDHVLAADGSVPPTFRKTLAATVVAYDGDLDTLRDRVATVAGRVDPGGAVVTAGAVVDAANRVLTDRSRLRDGVLALVRELAAARVPTARQAERDPVASDEVRLRWTAARRDLELLVAQPERLARQRLADRLKGIAPADEPVEEVAGPTREELLELD